MINWTALWPEVRNGLQSAVSDLQMDAPTLWSDIRYGENEAFPFWVFASINATGPTYDEDAVLSASFKSRGTAISFISDIASGDGLILAEGPTSEIESTDDPGVIEWAASCLRSFMEFVMENLPLVRDSLRE